MQYFIVFLSHTTLHYITLFSSRCHSGYLHGHVSYLDEECRVCLLLLSVNKDSFFTLSECRKKIKEVRRGCNGWGFNKNRYFHKSFKFYFDDLLSISESRSSFQNGNLMNSSKDYFITYSVNLLFFIPKPQHIFRKCWKTTAWNSYWKHYRKTTNRQHHCLTAHPKTPLLRSLQLKILLFFPKTIPSRRVIR